jgi:putative FmdB family regulatory protein
MPIYEYWCSGCRKKVEIFFLRLRESEQPACPHCKGLELRRLVSRFSSPKSEEARLESLADPSRLAGLDENDPASMARWVKRMGRELGEDIGGEEIDQMAEEIATGEGPGNDAGEPAHGVSGGPDSGDL